MTDASTDDAPGALSPTSGSRPDLGSNADLVASAVAIDERESYNYRVAEVQRIIRTGTVWTAGTAVAAALLLGPMVASGWRPGDLPLPAAAIWWLGAAAAAVGIALLVWAGCPVLGFTLDEAHPQKVFSIRVGIVLSLSGMALAGLAVLFSPIT